MLAPEVRFYRSARDEEQIAVPALGLSLVVKLPTTVSGGMLTVIETTNAPGFGPPLHRHREAEIFRVLEGHYLYEVDEKRFYAEAGDVVSVPGGAAHAFVNLTNSPARQLILITPGLDATAFFTELGSVMIGGRTDKEALDAFGQRWGVEFLGPPLRNA
jgi:quercetin dioxygenase-like cupin family protein